MLTKVLPPLCSMSMFAPCWVNQIKTSEKRYTIRAGEWYSPTCKTFFRLHNKRRGEYNICMSTCERCSKELTGKQTRWCSQECSKLGLKSLYRKRHSKKLNEYKAAWRKLGKRPLDSKWGLAKKRKQLEDFPVCINCGGREDLQVAHIKPLAKGGDHSTLLTLCRKHHYEFDETLRNFW